MAPTQAAPLRLQVTVLGALAGVAGWLIWDVLYDGIADHRLFMLLAATTYGTFFMLLALVGPARLWPSLRWAAGVSAGASALLYGASFRHASAESFLSAAYPLVAFWLFLVIATPFVAARLRPGDGWLSYPALFDLSWRIFVRYLAAVLFTALFWGLIGLSDALLNLVGLRLLHLITAVNPLAWVLSGAVFGLALAVVHELREYLSPYLVLQLLRLLLPVVLGVVVVFLLALPVQGLSNLVGDLSAAGTLMSAALSAIVLITVAVDRDQAEEVRLRWLRGMVQVLALLVPVLAALAVYALWLRVEAYGWTPQRLMAATVAAMVLLYGLAYGGSVVLRRRWAERIRQANVALALVTLAVILIWLSPVLVPERISARDQLARYQAGSLPPAEVPLREMSREWGLPGTAALDAIRQDQVLAERIAALDAEETWTAATVRDDVVALMVVVGAEALSVPQLSDISDDILAGWLQSCRLGVAAGPGCALIFGDFVPGATDKTGLLLLRNADGRVTATSLRLEHGRLQFWGYAMDLRQGPAYDLPVDVLEAVHAGTARIAAPDINALIVGEHAIFPHN
ncbi:DUF4153 domain-containing protein [Puniceibacterium confluentis]|uniref:DUF4153 domain-containing protein n=1 Tax=Puniceibacterium confluentis TaxID=1958944 RepID=UPI001645E6D0|nr:DUF4153 domain-containing protein [Puniceibacterium confluentis]